MRRTLLIAVLVSAALPAAAHASFTPPQQVAAPGRFHRGFMAASDATGRLTVATRRAFDVPRLVERPAAGGAWADLPPVAGIVPRSFLLASSMAAAGDGALAVAWTVARSFDFSMLVAVRPPGGTLSPPVALAGPAAGGVDHPSIAVDAAGDVLIAYETGTKASHLRLEGRIAVAYRPAGRTSFVGPVVVERALGGPPMVALAADGTGIVAWKRNRALKTVTIGRGGRIDRVRTIARGVAGHAVVAAGPGSAATAAYRQTTVTRRGKLFPHRTIVRSVGRPAGGAFGRARTVFTGSGSGADLAIAADEDGRLTLAWTVYETVSRGNAPGRVRMAAGRAGRALGRSHAVAPRDELAFGEPVALAARAGRVGVAWRDMTPGRSGVRAASGPWATTLAPTLIPSAPPVEAPAIALAADGHATAFWRAGAVWASDGP
jgi:hypothetical protein